MSDSPSRNLSIQLGNFGPLAIQPTEIHEDEMARAQCILFPTPIPAEHFSKALEWAASSQAPIFCTASDLKRFEQEGFGAYRFHMLGGFRELGFSEGSLKFVPARQKNSLGWRGLMEDLADAWGWSRREAFHVIVRNPELSSVLYLATPFIDKTDWSLLCEDGPAKVLGNPQYGSIYWTALAEKLGVEIEVLVSPEDAHAHAARKIFGSAQDFAQARASQNAPAEEMQEDDVQWKNAEKGSGS
jgi:hypothetical protein